MPVKRRLKKAEFILVRGLRGQPIIMERTASHGGETGGSRSHCTPQSGSREEWTLVFRAFSFFYEVSNPQHVWRCGCQFDYVWNPLKLKQENAGRAFLVGSVEVGKTDLRLGPHLLLVATLKAIEEGELFLLPAYLHSWLVSSSTLLLRCSLAVTLSLFSVSIF